MTESVRTQLTYRRLIDSTRPEALIDNACFMPTEDAQPAKHSLCVSLTTLESPMSSDKSMLGAQRYVERRADLFPAVTVQLRSDGDDLIPLNRGLLRASAGDSYWDLVLAPGRVWSEPGDGGMSRAALPFLLCNELENDTHHGVACFLFDNESVTHWRIQIAIETKPFVVPEEFDAWGVVSVERTGLDSDVGAAKVFAYQQEKSEQHPLHPLSALPDEVPQSLFDALESGFGADTGVVHGLIIDDAIYVSDCNTRAGAFPFVREMQLGLWSATKTAFGTVACLRLAQTTGEDCRGAIIADLLPEARVNPRWGEITIGDCLNMATSVGTVGNEPSPPNVFSDYVLDEALSSESALHQESYKRYFEWFLADSKAEKNAHAFACPNFSWQPGEVARYRDQDLYIAGVAMDTWLKRKRGPDAHLWHMVRDEVYEPCGLRHAINFHTRESGTAEPVPLTDAGLLLTLDNVTCLSRLLHEGGKVNGEQILEPSMLAEVFDPAVKKGLPTGMHTTDGEAHYHFGTWHLPYRSAGGAQFWLPTMLGYGGQTIQLLANGMTAFRFAHDHYGSDERYDTLKLVRIADAITPFSS